MRLALLGLALSSALLVAAPANAQHDHAGHAATGQQSDSMLASSTPVDGAVLDRAPRTLTLVFAHPVILQTAVITGPGDAPVQASFRRATTPTAVYSIALPQLSSGTYETRWTASGGGHAMQGELSFTVQ